VVAECVESEDQLAFISREVGNEAPSVIHHLLITMRN
jgi:hypothetical protein